jgi:hypothetical protein
VFAGPEQFAALHDAEPGTFYLTDYLALHFEQLVWAGLGLDRHPQLRHDYFGNYARVVWLAQTDDPVVADHAQSAADRLGLPLETVRTGRDALTVAVLLSCHAASS